MTKARQLANLSEVTINSPAIEGASTLAVNSTSPALRITQLGTGSALVVEDETSDTTPFVVDAAGNVGVGFVSPNAKLGILGVNATVYDGTAIDAGDSGVNIENGQTAVDGAAASLVMRVRGLTGAGVGIASINAVRTSNGSAAVAIATRHNGGTVTERLRIDSAGNVGIGITPSTKLHISYAANGGPAGLTLNSATRTDADNILSAINVIGNVNYGSVFNLQMDGQVQFRPLGTERLRIDSSGNVGIGTSAPGSALEVARTGASAAQVRATSGTGVASFRAANDGGVAGLYLDNSIGSSFGVPYSVNLYATGAVPLRLWTNDVERLRIDSSGNVGIGTSAPAARFDLGAGSIANSAHAILVRGLSDSNYQLRAVNGETGVAGAVQATFGLSYAGTSNDVASFRFIRGASTTDASLAVWTNNTERLRIDSSGNVGIGTSVGYGRLFVSNGSGSDSGEFRAIVIGGNNSDGSARTASIIKNTSSPYDLIFRNQDNTGTTSGSFIFRNGATERLRIDSAGNVGIGSAGDSTYSKSAVSDFSVAKAATWTAGSFRSYVNSANGGGMLVLAKSRGASVGTLTVTQSGDTLGALTFEGVNSSSANRWAAGIFAKQDGAAGATFLPGRIEFHTGTSAADATERLRIDSSGNVLVGTTSAPAYGAKVRVQGIIETHSTQFSMAPGSGLNFEWVNRNGAGQAFYVNNAGVVATLSTTGVWTNASDARYKENIRPISYGLSAITHLQPRAYNVIGSEKEEIGFVAQEVETVLPELVDRTTNSVTGEDRLTLSYGQMSAVLVKAIQEQQEMITSLTTELESIKLRVAELEPK